MSEEKEQKNEELMDKIVSLSKRRGFIFQGSEIYGGLAGTWDYGPLGIALKNNVKSLWWKKFVDSRDDIYGLDAAILMNAKVWEASGHVAGFADPMIECAKCKSRFRDDQVREITRTTKSLDTGKERFETGKFCTNCKNLLSEPRQFNMMFKTTVGALEDSSSVSYLRPETAQGIFANFKNVVDSFHPKLPFGIGQIGKAFRNEITPRDFIFRTREFEQMEIEFFLKEKDWEKYFQYWKDEMMEWMQGIGLDMNHVHELEVPAEDRAHYSKRTVDFEFDFPFGRKELYGLAYRTDFDLKNHSAASGVDLSYLDEEAKERFLPHVIEPTFGVDRTVLALLSDAYSEDDSGDEKRVFIKFKPSIAPIKAAVFPLLKNKPELTEKARTIYGALKSVIPNVAWDDNGNIGKRYRRQDEIGTPFCITVDFDTLSDDTVTVRNRDTGMQERIHEKDLNAFLLEKIS